MSESPEPPKTKLVQCQHEFQEKLHEMQTPPPPLIRSANNQHETEYNVMDEITRVHRLIRAHGEQGDFGMQMKFGNLIPIYGNNQVDKLSEVLANARKNGFVSYTLKDFLQQDRDEDIYIRLVKTPV
ncbi:unnamed protein product [Adineta steineri]|uniref:Costars domain-containing protein n=1 Tax=Adineta steineri TaxID=433720 RepID=A0A814KR04_9BILA|nr:unnamed protein product [Adineta steineri]CAF1343675.1 unnamed protein product [Adineta steineri]